jgi:heme/copper-type cytochrome/quinol oxidase subunit 1
LPTADKSKFSGFFSLASDKSASPVSKSLLSDDSGLFFSWRSRKKISIAGYEDSSYFNPLKLALYQDSVDYPEGFWYLAEKVSEARRRKVFFSKCSNRTLTTSGWTFITPMSSNTKYTGYGAQDILLLSVVLAGVSTTISFTNLLITRRTLVSPGLRNRRVLMPFVTIAILLTLRMLAIVTPVLGAAVLMAFMDRYLQTAFFDFAYGGDPILFQHLFWFFGHPEVYILIIPGFGFINTMLPASTTRRMASKHHMIWAIYVMAYMGYVVWGHHMYLVGLDHRSRNMYSTITIMISLPATIKLVNWTLTLATSAIRVDLCLLFIISFIFFFLTGGFTGMWLSHVALNVSMHDSFYVVAHFHLMLAGGALVSSFAGVYYYFYPLFGTSYSKIFGHLHLAYYSAGIWLTFLPMFYLAFSGLPRRIHDFPAVFLGWQGVATSGHMLALVGAVFFFAAILESSFENSVFTSPNLGLPRWQKRIHYYLFKLKFNKSVDLMFRSVPNANARLRLIEDMFNEYESYSRV